MWSELTNFGFKRTKKQAFGFYLAYLVLIMLIGFVVGTASSVITGMDSFSAGDQRE
jgi:type IV secretory pathway TrbL component